MDKFKTFVKIDLIEFLSSNLYFRNSTFEHVPDFSKVFLEYEKYNQIDFRHYSKMVSRKIYEIAIRGKSL